MKSLPEAASTMAVMRKALSDSRTRFRLSNTELQILRLRPFANFHPVTFERINIMRMILMRSILVLLGIMISVHSQSQTLPTVYVSGSYAWGGGFGSGFGFGSQPGAAPFQEYPAMVAAIEQHRSLINVRCSGGAYRDVTSHSDELSRQLAAETIFRVVKQPDTLWRRVFRSAPYQNGILLIIYADGGQEQFKVTNPEFSSAMPAGPIPGTLKQGNGQIQPHHICG